MSIKKIVIIGPESTGKTILTAALAKHFNTNFVAEYARRYLEHKTENYTIDDLDIICKRQLLAEQQVLSQSNKILFIDTNAYSIKIWSEVKYNTCSKSILDAIVDNNYDYYLLLDIDLPWQYDPLREAPNLTDRKYLMHHYTDAIINSGVPFSIISGSNEARLENAIAAINSYLLL
jgi:NadR type nicotinamide-nucleotide adenylyltransferase